VTQETATGLRVGYLMAGTTGGIGRHVRMLADGCAAAGLQVMVFAPPDVLGSLACSGQTAGSVLAVPVQIADRPGPASLARSVLALRRALADSGLDVLHAHGIRAGGCAALALRKQAGGPSGRPQLVVTVHNPPPRGRIAAAGYRMVERLIANRADVVFAVSDDLLARLRQLGAPDLRLAPVPAPVAPLPAADAVAAVRTSLDAAWRPVLLTVARLADQKGHDVLLAAVAALSAAGRPVVALAGEGPLAGRLAAQAQATGLDVRFLGQRSDVPALLAAADVVVLPSRWEGQPLILAEAMRAGRPVIATQVGGVPGMTGSDGALLVPPDDAEALAAAINRVLSDEQLAARLGKQAAAQAARLPMAADAIRAVLDCYAGRTAEHTGSS
jgi:glycosyltransferase involved in cell wall biosynthesis